MLWKESLCKTWIVFILIKCICLIIIINHVWSRVKSIALKKKHIVFPKNPLFYQKTHCFPTCALFYPIVLKRKIITGWQYVIQQPCVLTAGYLSQYKLQQDTGNGQLCSLVLDSGYSFSHIVPYCKGKKLKDSVVR